MEKLTIELASNEFEKIKSMLHDDEAAHSCEDSLANWFIVCLSEKMYDNIETITSVAKIISKTSELDFARWCA